MPLQRRGRLCPPLPLPIEAKRTASFRAVNDLYYGRQNAKRLGMLGGANRGSPYEPILRSDGVRRATKEWAAAGNTLPSGCDRRKKGGPEGKTHIAWIVAKGAGWGARPASLRGLALEQVFGRATSVWSIALAGHSLFQTGPFP